MQLLPGNASKDQGEFKQGTVLNPFDAPDPSRAAVKDGWIIDSATKMRYDNSDEEDEDEEEKFTFR